MVDHAEDICRHVEHNILIMRIVTVVLPLLLHLLHAEGGVGHALVLQLHLLTGTFTCYQNIFIFSGF